MTFKDQTPNSEERLAAWLKRLEARIGAVEQRGFVIPVLDADPAEDDPTSMWLLNDGRIRTRNADGTIFQYVPDVDLAIHRFSTVPSSSDDHAKLWVGTSSGTLRIQKADGTWWQYFADLGGSSTGTPAPSTSSSVPKPSAPKAHQHRQVWTASNAKTFCPQHGVESQLYYGRWSSTHGERRVMFTFNDSDIRSTLSGAAIKKVEMKVRNRHSYSNSGIYIHWGGHNRDSMPGAFSQRYRNVWSAHWPKVGGDVWRTMPAWFGRAFRDNLIKGLTIDQPSSGVSFYGQTDSGLDLRITYTHKH